MENMENLKITLAQENELLKKIKSQLETLTNEYVGFPLSEQVLTKFKYELDAILENNLTKIDTSYINAKINYSTHIKDNKIIVKGVNLVDKLALKYLFEK